MLNGGVSAVGTGVVSICVVLLVSESKNDIYILILREVSKLWWLVVYQLGVQIG